VEDRRTGGLEYWSGGFCFLFSGSPLTEALASQASPGNALTKKRRSQILQLLNSFNSCNSFSAGRRYLLGDCHRMWDGADNEAEAIDCALRFTR
jgi:hypothetical protein